MSQRRGWARGQRSFARRLFDLGIAKVATIFGRALLFFALGLTLDAGVYGDVAVLYAIAVGIVVAMELGLGYLFVREAALGPETLKPALGGLLLLRGILVVPLFGAYATIAWQLFAGEPNWLLMLTIGFAVLPQQVANSALACLRGTQQTTLEAVTGVALSGAEALAVVLWVFVSQRDVTLLFAVIAGLRLLYLAAVLAAVLRRFESSVRVSAALSFIRGRSRLFGVFALISVSQFWISQAAVFILRWYHPSAEVGRYAASARLMWIVLLPCEIALAAVLPRLASSRENQQGIFHGLHGLTAIWTLAVAAAAILRGGDLIAVLLGPQIGVDASLFALVAVGLMLAYLPPYGIGLLMGPSPRGLAAVYLGAAGIATAVGFLLIPDGGAMAAGWALLTGYAALKVGFVVLFALRRLACAPAIPLLLTTLSVGAWALVDRATQMHPAVSLGLLAVITGLLYLRSYRPFLRQIDGTPP